MGAWNYPLLLTLSPVIDALGAGNHVMLKPSEVTPRTADAIASLIGDTFPAEYATTVIGGPDVATVFSALPFDHLIFTGSTRVGALVMRAASANLTPVTLELGGKSPVIVHRDFPLPTASRRIWSGKLYNAGQTCVAPDYLLIPQDREAEFERLAHGTVSELYPRLVDNPEYTRIVNQRHYERLAAAVADAEQRGARVVTINPAGESCTPDNRVFPPTLVFRPAEAMEIMREEIFGPVLPVVTYRTLDDAIAFVNNRPRPLALYYFDRDSHRIDDVLRRTMSGGVTVNDVMYHLAQPNLPFGGVGMSGMGHYHGFDGFETFSKKRGVMVQARWPTTALFRPPYGPRTKALMRQLLRLALR
jgi:coniferyl-aldehyde dehydrogenase